MDNCGAIGETGRASCAGTRTVVTLLRNYTAAVPLLSMPVVRARRCPCPRLHRATVALEGSIRGQNRCSGKILAFCLATKTGNPRSVSRVPVSGGLARAHAHVEFVRDCVGQRGAQRH